MNQQRTPAKRMSYREWKIRGTTKKGRISVTLKRYI